MMKSDNHFPVPRLQTQGAFFVLVFALVGLLFIFRSIPLTSDDEYYLDYFSGIRGFDYDSLLELVIDEPLFKIVTNAFVAMFPPVTCVRILIFLGILPHFLYLLKSDNVKASLYVASYFFIVELAVHLSWVQLRQGFAIGVLLILFLYLTDKWKWLGVALVGLIHTSMFVLLPCFFMPWVRSKKMAYIIVIGLAGSLLFIPGILEQFTFLMGRRERSYDDSDVKYGTTFIIYSLGLMVYVTLFAKDDENADSMLMYHTMCALVLPMFSIPIIGAFAERLFFFVRWYEMSLVIRSNQPNSVKVSVVYLLMNIAYSIYHSIRYFGGGGYFDRIRLMLVSG